MSRRIKTYPFNQKFNDELAADADSIKDLKLPGAYVECVSVETGQKEIVSIKTKVYALEESKGVHLYLVEEDKDGVETDKKSEEIIVDEIQFCDALHDAICKETTAEETPFIQQIITTAIENYAKSEVSGDRWLCTVNYDGFGVIRSGESIIGTFDRVNFSKDTVTLDYSVGNVNLNNIADCNIWFKTGSKCFKFTEVSMKSVTSTNDYYCTYVLDKYKGKFLSEICVDDSVFEGLVRYSEQTAEQFLEERTSIIDNEDDEEDNSFFDDIL